MRWRIRTEGRTLTVVRNGDPEMLHPDFLMAKTGESRGDFDRRSVFDFTLPQDLDLEDADSARVRLNLVPCGLGFATRLPQINRFALYGIRDGSTAEDWTSSDTWATAPTTEQGEWLGSFEIPRSRKRGVIGIDSPALLEFLRQDTNGKVTLVLIRETTETEGQSLVHAFASDTHPSAPGPVLEVW